MTWALLVACKLPAADISSTVRHVQSLFAQCEGHSKCQRSLHNAATPPEKMAFPVRLIEITYSRAIPKLRLVEFMGDIPDYITLSHRWPKSQNWKTCRENFEQSLADIPFAQLPRSFQDAVTFTHRIGKSYIWIDAICIIQDDNDDWEQQSSQMGLIFERSFCTFAAVDAFTGTSGVDEGLFASRDTMSVKIELSSAFTVQYDLTVQEMLHPPSQLVYTKDRDPVNLEALSAASWDDSEVKLSLEFPSFDMTVDRSSWNTRGWVFQERLLSKRVLFFTREQVFWECAEAKTSQYDTGYATSKVHGLPSQSESTKGDQSGSAHNLHKMLWIHPTDRPKPLPVPGRPAFREVWDEHQRLETWWFITKRYSECDLTYGTDRWFAIKGLCEVLRHHYDSDIYAGIWGVGVGACLLWHARSGPLSPIGDFPAPSWSWLGVKGPIGYAYADESYGQCIQHVRGLIEHSQFERVRARDACQQGEEGGGGGQLMERPKHGFSGGLLLTCPVGRVRVSSMTLGDLRLREVTGQSSDPPAWRFFQDITAGPEERNTALALEREYKATAGSLPHRTRLLFSDKMYKGGDADDRRCCLGWVVLDREVDEMVEDVVYCAGIVLRVLLGRGSFETHVVECLVLTREDEGGEVVYRRLGRGRIVSKTWVDECEQGADIHLI